MRDEPASGDGHRVLVDRVWPRGVSKEDAALDDWLKEVGPSTELRQWFDHDPEKFEEFAKRYEKELAGNEDLYATQLRTDIEMTFESDLTDAEGLGAMSDEQWQTTIDLLVEQGVIEDAPSVDDVRDSTFISAAND